MENHVCVRPVGLLDDLVELKLVLVESAVDVRPDQSRSVSPILLRDDAWAQATDGTYRIGERMTSAAFGFRKVSKGESVI